jgi:hypothetical protein
MEYCSKYDLAAPNMPFKILDPFHVPPQFADIPFGFIPWCTYMLFLYVASEFWLEKVSVLLFVKHWHMHFRN